VILRLWTGDFTSQFPLRPAPALDYAVSLRHEAALVVFHVIEDILNVFRP
jgi:hypothetical protein